ncbi:hypothetical protein LJR235_002869 [Pararhizobium sp. LjRoot235]|uniref:hypothetical protein n=1 Tax=Pararhizobium sp. LjRoot235 TaxID=3342291 RepID=UPI003ECC50A4
MQNKIEISVDTYAAEKSDLADYYCNRSLILAQKLADMTKGFHETSNLVAELREQIEAMSKPIEEEDRALAALLRAFVSEGNIAPPAVESLMLDARRVMSRGGE